MPLLHFALAMLQLAGIEDLPIYRDVGLETLNLGLRGLGCRVQGVGFKP